MDKKNKTADAIVDIDEVAVEMDETNERFVVAQTKKEDQPDWIKEHIAKYGKKPKLFDGV